MSVIVAAWGAAFIPGAAAGSDGATATLGAGLPGWVMVAGVLGAAAVSLGVLWARGAIRPSSLGRRRGRDLGDLRWWSWLATGLTVLVAQGAGAGAGRAVSDGVGLPADSMGGRALMQAGGLLAAALAGGAFIHLMRRGLPASGAGAGLRARLSDIPVGALCFGLVLPILLAASMAATWAYTLLAGRPPDPIAHETLRKTLENRGDPWVWATLGAAVLGAPVVEEMLYRVFLQSLVLSVTSRVWAAVLVSSTLFAISHAGQVPWHAMAVLWVLGAALGLAYERTRRLGVPMVMHLLFNAGNAALALALPPGAA